MSAACRSWVTLRESSGVPALDVKTNKSSDQARPTRKRWRVCWSRQDRDRRRTDTQRAAGAIGLRLGQLPRPPLEGVPDGDRADGEVHVRPPEAEQFTLPHPGHDRGRPGDQRARLLGGQRVMLQ